MRVKSTASQYGMIAVAIHWISALMVVMLVVTGFRASGQADSAMKAAVLMLHVPVGTAILLLTLGRVLWWLFADKKPASLPMPAWQEYFSNTVHSLFYVVIFGMALSGFGMLALSGAAPIIFGWEPSTLPDFQDYFPRTPHGLGARLIVILFVIHAGAALYHHLIKRDGLLRRMSFGRGPSK